MIDAINAAQIALLQDQLRMQSITQNITNMQTLGYKRQLIAVPPFTEQLDAELTLVNQNVQRTQLCTQGTILKSENPHDIAISGNGFFAVQTSEGIFYTRRGDLRINERGELCLATGGLLLGKSGPIVVDGNDFRIDSQGLVSIGQQNIDQLNLVQFKQMQKLTYRGLGLYETDESPSPVTSDTRVWQGFIEQSNVKSTDEMLEMMKTSRHYEAAQRILHTADGLLATAINQLGERNV